MPDKASINTETLMSNKKLLCSMQIMTVDPQRQKPLRADFQNLLRYVFRVVCVFNQTGAVSLSSEMHSLCQQ